MTAPADTYGHIPDRLEHIADTRGAVSDYLVGLAQVRALVAVANELAALREAVEGAAMSLDHMDGQLQRGVR